MRSLYPRPERFWHSASRTTDIIRAELRQRRLPLDAEAERDKGVLAVVSGMISGLDMGVGLDGATVGAAMGWAANKAPSLAKIQSRVRTPSDKMMVPCKQKLEASGRSRTKAVVVSSRLGVSSSSLRKGLNARGMYGHEGQDLKHQRHLLPRSPTAEKAKDERIVVINHRINARFAIVLCCYILRLLMMSVAVRLFTKALFGFGLSTRFFWTHKRYLLANRGLYNTLMSPVTIVRPLPSATNSLQYLPNELHPLADPSLQIIIVLLHSLRPQFSLLLRLLLLTWCNDRNGHYTVDFTRLACAIQRNLPTQRVLEIDVVCVEGWVDLAFERGWWISERRGGGAAEEDTIELTKVQRRWNRNGWITERWGGKMLAETVAVAVDRSSYAGGSEGWDTRCRVCGA